MVIKRVPVSIRDSSVKSPTGKPEKKYVTVIEKKRTDRDHPTRIPSVIVNDKRTEISREFRAEKRINPVSRDHSDKIADRMDRNRIDSNGLAFGRKRPHTVRESITKVIEQRKSVSVNESKNVKIEGNNNIYVEGNYYEAKNYKPAKDYSHYSKISHSTGHIHYITGHKWCNCGRFHLLRWSNRSCSRIVYFKKGLSFGYSYFYPDHHRKYLFVSIGGCIPTSYRYVRYYRYGCHPDNWYGSQPYEYPSVDNSVTNIYNDYRPVAYDYQKDSTYYDYDGTVGTTYSHPFAGYGDSALETSRNTHYEDYSNVDDHLAADQMLQVEEAIEDLPAEETLADIYFGNTVEAFAGGDYQSAIDAINKAIALAPNDEVMPFTLVQSLFAAGRHRLAAAQLREIFYEMPRDREVLYYPRGLYPDEKILDNQIAELTKMLTSDPTNGDLNLLLAYHLLGTGQLDKVASPLYQAQFDEDNSVSVAVMEDMLEDAQKQQQLEIETNL